MAKRTLAVDFDGVLHEQKPGDWKGIGVTTGKMMYRASHHLKILADDYKIVIHSCRAVHPEGVEAIRKFCVRNDIPFDEIVVTKPIAALYIDDRACHFTGWAETAREVRRRLEK